mgnify:CR=1 FL=1
MGKGWAVCESPYILVDPGTPCVVRLSVKQGLTSGAARVFLFKYDADRTPLDLPVREQAAFGPALVGQLEAGEQWQRRRFTKQIEPGVAYVRLYLQCFGVQGQAAFDDISIRLEDADPGLVDDCDEPGGWSTGFPEASLARETEMVHQGDGALRFSVNIDHEGGEAAHPIGWPHLRRRPSPPLDWTGKQALTFWVHADTSREALPQQAVIFAAKSAGGDALSVPLRLEKGVWQQVTIPMAGKQLSAVNHMEFFVCESSYNHGDKVTFVIDDMRLAP